MNLPATSFEITRRQWLGGAAAAGMVGAFGGSAVHAQSSFGWPNVTKLIERYVAERKVSGMVAALAFGRRDPVFIARGYDTFARPRQSDADSIYRIYSMTKPITGMAAMMLIDEGKLGLDQPLYEILPAFKSMKVQKVYDGPITADNLEPAVRPITIRMLLTHTSGLGYGIVQQGPIAEAYRNRGVVPGLVTRLQNLPVFRGTAVPSLKLFADRLAEFPLVYQPGTRWSYSMGADLMGRVIEVVSGQKFDDFLQHRLFDPLGMGDTHFQVPRSDADRMTTSYYIANGTLIPIPGREVMVQSWYQGGISVFDWTDPAHPKEIAYFDRGPMDSTRLVSGGYWSSYWYNGYIVGSEISRGLDLFELTPSAYLSQNEIDAAKSVRFDHFNAQEQPQLVWPATFALPPRCRDRGRCAG